MERGGGAILDGETRKGMDRGGGTILDGETRKGMDRGGVHPGWGDKEGNGSW